MNDKTYLDNPLNVILVVDLHFDFYDVHHQLDLLVHPYLYSKDFPLLLQQNYFVDGNKLTILIVMKAIYFDYSRIMVWYNVRRMDYIRIVFDELIYEYVLLRFCIFLINIVFFFFIFDLILFYLRFVSCDMRWFFFFNIKFYENGKKK